MCYFFFSIAAAFWFKFELNRFPQKINCQIYENMHSLIPLPFSLLEMQKKSILQPKTSFFSQLYFVFFPTFTFLFTIDSIFIIVIIFILCYLSLIDYYYYLTDVYYVAIIFMLSLFNLLSFNSLFIDNHIMTLVVTMLFFSIFIPLAHWIFKKTALGSGDVILFIALSPLFELNDMLQLLLFSSLFGLLFSGFYWFIKKQRLMKLPFIPFISLAFLVCIP